MTRFIGKLNLFYQKQPAQIRKVLACLKELSEEENVNMEKIRSKICPLFKSNQLLADWFLQCFGNEKRMTECGKDEYETITFRKTVEVDDDDAEAYEHIPQCEILPDPTDNPCHIRYMNGRLFYGNRFSFPAKLAFSTPVSAECGNIELGTANKMSSSNGRQQSYRCIHDVWGIGDTKAREKPKSQVDTDHSLNYATADEYENSDDEQHLLDEAKITPHSEEAERDDPNSASLNVLCDDITLKAHKIRLNPSVYSSPLTSSADFLSLLKPIDQTTVENDGKGSPKKSPMSRSSMQTLMKSRKCSPTTKKVNAVALNQSPNKKTSMQPQTAQTHPPQPALPMPCESSTSLQTAKRVKRILDSTIRDIMCCGDSKASIESAKKRISLTEQPQSLSQKFRKIPVKPQKRAASEKKGSGDTQADANGVTNKCSDIERPPKTDEIRDNIIWTREEDRLLLEHIKNGLEPSDIFIENIVHELPHKTADRIKLRVEFLIDFLTKLKFNS